MRRSGEVAVTIADEKGGHRALGFCALGRATVERRLPVRTHHGHPRAEPGGGRRHEQVHRQLRVLGRDENYSTDELLTIMERHAEESGYTCPAATSKALHTHIDAIPRDRSFGNARLARQLLETMITHQARRLTALRQPSVDDLRTLLPEDLPTAGPGLRG
ncbi:hypothetical protein SAZ11_00770 [Streptomyces sp. FXJ1.4098]|nr:hypothetical protein [Streptomyces sp. FXJ1.4098]